VNILIRADSSSKIGLGHIMRDLVLAKQFVGDDVCFACQNLSGNINQKILDNGYRIHRLDSNSLKEFVDLVKVEKIDMVVFDNYEIDFEFEKSLKKQTGVKIFSLDDTYQKHHCDILLNHNICADTSRYFDLVSKSCEVRCGSKYTLIRDEFKIEKAKKRKVKIGNTQKTIFLAMGGVDHSNATLKILKVLKNFKGIFVKVVSTSANANLGELKDFASGKSWLEIYVDTKRMAKILNSCDFAVVTPSVILHEVIYMEIPFLAIKTADNQNEMVKFLDRKHFDVIHDVNELDENKILDLFEL